MSILLTGARGMVGRNILEHQLSVNSTILSPTSQELNLLDRNSIHNYLKKYAPDMIIHAAGVVGGIQANIAQPVKFLVDNLQMALNILTIAKEYNITKFMNLGSSCMYPKDGQNPLAENLLLTGELETTNEGYALAKIASAKLCDYISREDGTFQYKTVIPCNLYGKYDKFDFEYSHMVPAVIRKISEAKKREIDKVEIWGDGLARREFMYAGDFADFIHYAIENFNSMPSNINVGLGMDYTINEYYQEIARVIGYRGEFTHDLSKPRGMKQKLIDSSKLHKFGWQSKTSLTEGIRQTFEYYSTVATDA